MSGMDRLTIDDLQYWEEYGDYDAKLMARELLAHRRASQAAPAPSDGLREALGTLLVQANGVEPRDAMLRQNVIRIARAALSASPAQEGGE